MGDLRKIRLTTSWTFAFMSLMMSGGTPFGRILPRYLRMSLIINLKRPPHSLQYSQKQVEVSGRANLLNLSNRSNVQVQHRSKCFSKNGSKKERRGPTSGRAHDSARLSRREALATSRINTPFHSSSSTTTTFSDSDVRQVVAQPNEL